MADNLKVNAKSKILTFKKKHNLLVDKVNDVDEYTNELSDNITDLEENKIQQITIDTTDINYTYEELDEMKPFIILYKGKYCFVEDYDDTFLRMSALQGEDIVVYDFAYDEENEYYEFSETQRHEPLPSTTGQIGKYLSVSSTGQWSLIKSLTYQHTIQLSNNVHLIFLSLKSTDLKYFQDATNRNEILTAYAKFGARVKLVNSNEYVSVLKLCFIEKPVEYGTGFFLNIWYFDSSTNAIINEEYGYGNTDSKTLIQL